jgi:hypothetical protein
MIAAQPATWLNFMASFLSVGLISNAAGDIKGLNKFLMGQKPLEFIALERGASQRCRV